MTRVAGATLVLLAALAQITWAQGLTVLGVFPNLVLVVVVAIAWTYGLRASLALACAGGLILDLAAPGPLGPHAIALLCAVYLAGVWARNIDRAGVMLPALASALATLVYSGVLVGINDTLDLSIPPLDLALRVTLLAALYNSVVAVPVVIGIGHAHNQVHA